MLLSENRLKKVFIIIIFLIHVKYDFPMKTF